MKRKAHNSVLAGSPGQLLARLKFPLHPVFASVPPAVETAPGGPDRPAELPAQEPFDWRDRIPVLPYQWRWIRDDSQLKIAVWSRQSGKSFAAALRAVLKCMEKRTQYIILSKGERQSRLFMEKVKDFCQVFKELKVLPEFEEMQESDDKTMEVYFPTTARASSACPPIRTRRAVTPATSCSTNSPSTATRTRSLPPVSPSSRGDIPLKSSPHPMARRESFTRLRSRRAWWEVRSPMSAGPKSDRRRTSDSPRMKAGDLGPRTRTFGLSLVRPSRGYLRRRCPGACPPTSICFAPGCDDEETWLQEYGCQFLSDAQNYIPVELISTCVHEEATTEWCGSEVRSPKTRG